ncbi:MAG: type III secretion system cytoplasmic ring protein SctQ [Janthinobacterium lividum]
MDRPPFAASLRDHLPAYTQPVAALSRIRSPLIRALPAGHHVDMLRPGHLTLSTNVGNVRIRMDLAAQPALESIALDPEPARRVALANLYLQNLLDVLQSHVAAHGIHTLTIGELVPADARRTVLPGLGIVCRLPDPASQPSGNAADGTGGNVAESDESLWDGDFHCIVETLSPTLVDAFAATHAAHAAPPPCLLANLTGIPIPTRLRLTSRRYKRATLRSLQHGDVLLGWSCPHHNQLFAPEWKNDRPGDGPRTGAHWLWGSAGHMQGRHPVSIEGNRIHITGMPDMNDDRIAPSLPISAAADADFATASAPPADDARALDTSILDGVDLMVHLELGCIAMAAAELARVRPGDILTLPERISHATVNLVVSGRTVATGELVAVGDQLGVRVHRSGPAHG